MLWISLCVATLLSVVVFLSIWQVLKTRRKVRNASSGMALKPTRKHPRLHKVKRGLIVLVLGGAILFSSFYLGNRIGFARAVSGNARWIETGGQSYLYIEADTPYDLGYHTGVQLSNQIVALQTLLFLMAVVQGYNYFEMQTLASEYLPYIPDQYQQELLGTADGASGQSGLLVTFADVLLQAVFFDLYYGRIAPTHQVKPATHGCTALAANNSDGRIMLGQNVDLVKIFGQVGSFVLHKLGNDPLVFSYRYGACPAWPIGKNEYNVTLTFTLVQTNVIAPVTTPVFVLTREGLAHNTTALDLGQTFLSGTSSSFGRTFIIADDVHIIAAQVLPTNVTTEYPATIVVRTNTFLDPCWQATLANPTYSKERQAYAEGTLAGNYTDGNLSEDELLSILGDAPVICRDEEGLMGTATVAFMTRHSFGIGTANDAIGVIPI